MKLCHRSKGRLRFVAVESWYSEGVSHGFCDASADCRFDDKAWREHFAPANLVLLNQVHGEDVAVISGDNSIPESRTCSADGWFIDFASIGNETLAFGILTADCFPVLCLSACRRFAALGHFGWRGAVSKLTTKFVADFRQAGVAPQQIEVAIGPGIGRSDFEVGPEVVREFTERAHELGVQDVNWLLKRQIGTGQSTTIDVAEYLRQVFAGSGVPQDQICTDKRSTFTTESLFSYRRDAEQAGRQLSFMGKNIPLC